MLGLFWDHFGIIFWIHLRSFWDHFGFMLGLLWDYFGIILGSFWDQFGMTLGSFWDHFGMTLGKFWDHFAIIYLGIILASLWGHFGITLASLWDHFGSLWHQLGIIFVKAKGSRHLKIKCCERQKMTPCQTTYPQRTGRNDGRQHAKTLYHLPSNTPP